MAQKFHLAVLQIEVTRASGGLSAVAELLVQMVVQKLKPGLAASYDIQSENGEGLFWFWCLINLWLTYLLTYLDTYPRTYSPGTHTRHHQHVGLHWTTEHFSRCSMGLECIASVYQNIIIISGVLMRTENASVQGLGILRQSDMIRYRPLLRYVTTILYIAPIAFLVTVSL